MTHQVLLLPHVVPVNGQEVLINSGCPGGTEDTSAERTSEERTSILNRGRDLGGSVNSEKHTNTRVPHTDSGDSFLKKKNHLAKSAEGQPAVISLTSRSTRHRNKRNLTQRQRKIHLYPQGGRRRLDTGDQRGEECTGEGEGAEPSDRPEEKGKK